MVEIIKKADRIDWRKEINSRSPADAKEWQMKEYRRCVEDKPYWYDNYVWTIDTRKTPSIIPFQLYPHQEKLVKQLDKYQDLFIDKCRDMGISWTIMAWELHQACYTKGFTALNISRKETEVQDTGNTFHSLHGRLLFMWERLPPFLKPRIHNPFLVFKVPSMNSVIKGESANKNAGRDTQYRFILVDEAAFVDCLDEMYKGLRNATNSVCLNSTPPKETVNNKFAEIKNMKNSGFVKMGFDWHENPQHTPEWYKKKTSSMTEQEIAQEILRQYDKARTDRSYAEYSDNMHLLGHKVYLNPKSPLYCFMDFGLAGEVFLFAQKDFEDRIFFIYYKIFKDMLTPELYNEFLKCLGALRYTGEIKDIIFVGDKSGNKRSRQTKTSIIDDYKKISKGGINILSRELSNDEKMRCMKSCLKTVVSGKPKFNISREPTCLDFAKCMTNVRMNKTKTDHIDDWTTHAVNSAEYGINYLFPLLKAAAASVGLDPGQELLDIDGRVERVVESPILRGASAMSVIGARKIEKRRLI